MRSRRGTDRDAIAWWLEATGGYGVKLVNPGGVERSGSRTTASRLARRRGGGLRGDARARCSKRSAEQSTSSGYRIPSTSTPTISAFPATPTRRSTRCARCRGARRTSPTCSSTATAASPAVGGPATRSRAPELIEYLGDHPEITADVGQVMFGPAMTMTADAHVSAVLRDLDGGKWLNHDTEVETGCGIVPLHLPRRATTSMPCSGGSDSSCFCSAGPVAGDAVDRPPERRLVPVLSEADPPIDGPRLSARTRWAAPTSGDPAHRAARRARPRVHAERDRDHHARGSRAPPRPDATRATSGSAPTPTSRSTTIAPTARRCSPPLAT